MLFNAGYGETKSQRFGSATSPFSQNARHANLSGSLLKVDWPSLAIGAATATLSGLVIAWATPFVQKQELPPIELIYDAETVPLSDTKKDEAKVGEYLTLISIYNYGRHNTGRLELNLGVSIEDGEAQKIGSIKSKGYGYILEQPVSTSVMDDQQRITLRYKRFTSGGSHTLILRTADNIRISSLDTDRENISLSPVSMLAYDARDRHERIQTYIKAASWGAIFLVISFGVNAIFERRKKLKLKSDQTSAGRSAEPIEEK